MGEISQSQTVKLKELSKTEQLIVREYSPIIQQLFAVIGADTTSFSNEDDHWELKEPVKLFLEFITAVFSTKPIKLNVPLQNKQDKDIASILKQCRNKIRTVYRKQFRNVHSVTTQALSECEKEAWEEVESIFNPFLKNLQVSEEKQMEYLDSLHNLYYQEVEWIKLVNQFKMKKILDAIKSETMEDFRNDIEKAFSSLYGTTLSFTKFYDEEILAEKYKKMMTTAINSFEEQIPFTADEQVVLDVKAEFESELREKVIDDLVERNSSNKRTTESVMEGMMNRAVNLYRESLLIVINSHPLMETKDCLELLHHHEALNSNLVPTLRTETKIDDEDLGMEKLEVGYLNQYHKLIHECFSEMLEMGNRNALSITLRYHSKCKDISSRYVAEIQQVFEEFKVANIHGDTLKKKIERDLTEVIQEIKDSSLANLINVETLIAKSRPTKVLTKEEKLLKEKDVAALLEKSKNQYVQFKIQNRITASNGVTLSRQHESVRKETINVLERELQSKFRNDQSNEKYI